MEVDAPIGTVVTTDVPPRLDRLAFSHWHVRILIALGITWALDGLEASIIANLGPTLRSPEALNLSAFQVGLANSAYLLGEVFGALLFGHLTDRFGRRRLFFITLTIYLCATGASGLTTGFWTFAILRACAGAGIGGEYSAVNSAIDELIPARMRGQIDLAVNGSYWLGVASGGALTLFLLDPRFVPARYGWRCAFLLGALLGIVILIQRRHVPESPRWLLMHGHIREAEQGMAEIESQVPDRPREPAPKVQVHVTGTIGLGHLFHTLFVRYPKRTVLGLVLMIAQTFFYNSIFFTYGLILERFYNVAPRHVGLYGIPFAVGSFLGPLMLGHLFDHWGRRIMIPATYALAGLLLLATGALFVHGSLTALTQMLCWCVVFFFASAAASSAYLTVSELFPVELRGLAIAVFFSLATGAGAAAPSIFGRLVDIGSPTALMVGYAGASTLMLVAAIVARVLGVDSERRSLEEITAR